MGQFSMTISAVAGSVLSDNQHQKSSAWPDEGRRRTSQYAALLGRVSTSFGTFPPDPAPAGIYPIFLDNLDYTAGQRVKRSGAGPKPLPFDMHN